MSFHRSSSDSDSNASSNDSSANSSTSTNSSGGTSWLSLITQIPITLFSASAKNTNMIESNYNIQESSGSRSKKFQFVPKMLIDAICSACESFKAGSVTRADIICADNMLALCKSLRGAANEKKILLQIIHSIIGEKLDQQTVDIELSVALRNKLIDTLFRDYLLKFENHFSDIQKKSSRSHAIFLEEMNDYYKSTVSSYWGIDYPKIQLALILFKRILSIKETNEIITLLEFEKLAEALNCSEISYGLAKKTLALIGELVSDNDQSVHDKFLKAMHHYYSSRYRPTYDGVMRAINIMKVLLPLDEVALMKALISIQAMAIQDNDAPLKVSIEDGYKDLNNIGSAGDQVACMQLLTGSTVLREELKKLICGLVNLDEKDFAIQITRCELKHKGETAKAIEVAKNRVLLICLALALKDKLKIEENKIETERLSSPTYRLSNMLA